MGPNSTISLKPKVDIEIEPGRLIKMDLKDASRLTNRAAKRRWRQENKDFRNKGKWGWR